MKNSKKENARIRRIAVKAVLTWIMFRAVALGIVVLGATTIWDESTTIAQKIVAVVITVAIAIASVIIIRFDNILDDAIENDNINHM